MSVWGSEVVGKYASDVAFKISDEKSLNGIYAYSVSQKCWKKV